MTNQRVRIRILTSAASRLVLTVLVAGVAGCAPSTGPTDPGSATSAKPKVLTLGILIEPANFNLMLANSVTPAGGGKSPFGIVHNLLSVNDTRGGYVPQLATELISVEKGTWRANADGTMDTVWKIRPNITWHDGKPFTSDDLMFTLDVYKDTASGARQAAVGRIQHATAPDPLTFEIRWSSVYTRALRTEDYLDPLPRHRFEEIVQADIANVDRSPMLSTDFIGLGPYQLIAWERGSHMEFARFDNYYLGRPPLERVTVRLHSDKNTILAAVLAGALDSVVPRVLNADEALEVRKRWEGTGNRVQFPVANSARVLIIQFRPELAQPPLTNRIVRHALYHATDRQALADNLTSSLSPAADNFWFSPADETRPQVEASIPQYPYDPTRAQQVLAQAGWGRGPDGSMVHSQTGARLAIDLTYLLYEDQEQVSVIVADQWKGIGAEVRLSSVPAAFRTDRELFAAFPGVRPYSHTGEIIDFYHSGQVASSANRWSGRNIGGYQNPSVDALVDKLFITIDRSQQVPLWRELLKEQMGDVPFIPLYWDVRPWLAVGGIRGIRDDGETWEIFHWDRE